MPGSKHEMLMENMIKLQLCTLALLLARRILALDSNASFTLLTSGGLYDDLDSLSDINFRETLFGCLCVLGTTKHC